MIILRQKEYATGAERAMIKLSKPKQDIDSWAKEQAREYKRKQIKSIQRHLSRESTDMNGKGGSLIGNMLGKEARMRLRMGYNSPAAVERLRKSKIKKVLADEKSSSEYYKSQIHSNKEFKNLSFQDFKDFLKDGAKSAKNVANKVADKAKHGVKYVYNDTGKITRKAAQLLRKNADIAAVSGGAAGAGFLLPPAANVVYQGITNVARPSAGYIGLKKWVGLQDRPVVHKIKDADGKYTGKTKVMPASKRKVIRTRNFIKKLDNIFGDWSIKSNLEKVKESHRASHPYENIVPAN